MMKLSATFFVLLVVADNAFDLNLSRLEKKIIGGNYVCPGIMACIVSVRLRATPFQHRCGGSLVSIYHVLTCAHCVHPVKINKIVDDTGVGIVAGTNNIAFGGEWYDVANTALDENYCPFFNESNSDIAILMLVDKIRFTPYISLIGISLSPIVRGMQGIISGWGCVHPIKNLDGTKFLSGVLKSMVFNVISNFECEKLYAGIYNNSNHICVMPANSGELPSVGDSGSPLIINGYIEAVLSQGKVELTGMPFIGVKVSSYKKLIDGMMSTSTKRQMSEKSCKQPRRSIDPRSK